MKWRLSTLAQTAVLLAATLLAGVGGQLLRREPLPWFQNWSRHVEESAKHAGVPVVDLAQAAVLVQNQSHVILDARPHADFAAGHLPGAFSVPSQAMDEFLPQVMPLLTPAQPILTYCSGHACDESVTLSRHLLQNGFTNVVLFVGGWSDWTAAGMAVEK